MFVLYAEKNQLGMKQREPVTSGSVNVYPVQFQFSSEWDGLSRTAVFMAGPETRSILLDDSNQCNIPWEVLTEHGRKLYAGVYGTLGEDTVLPTIWTGLGTILEGTTTGETTQEPTPGVYEQILSELQDIQEKIEGEEGIQGPPGPEGPPGESASEIYSTEETRIGTWIDGKPLYRRVIQITSPSTTDSYKYYSIPSPPPIENICKIDGVIHSSSGYDSPVNCSRGDFWCSTQISKTKIAVQIFGNWLISRPMDVVLEYTKTTD